MLCIRKESKDKSVWCTYDEGVEFLIKPLSADIVDNLRKPFVKKTIGASTVTREVEIKDVVDDDKFNDAIIDYIIEDWKGVYDENEVLLPCTLENKKAAMDIVDISEFVFKSARKIPTLSAKAMEVELGN